MRMNGIIESFILYNYSTIVKYLNVIPLIYIMSLEHYIHTRENPLACIVKEEDGYYKYLGDKLHPIENKLKTGNPFARKEVLYFLSGDVIDHYEHWTFIGPMRLRVEYLPKIKLTNLVVPGIVREWKSEETKEGLKVSKIETVRNEKTKEKIIKKLHKKYGELIVNFW